MQISNSSPQYNVNKNITFGSQKLFPVLLEKTLVNGTKEKISAHFSLLEKSDIGDLFKHRKEIKNTKYGEYILDEIICFFKKRMYSYNFFGIELEQKTKKFEGLSSVFNSNWLEIDYLQNIKQEKSIKGIGTALLYGICKFAQKNNKNHIELIAADETLYNFYKNIGFTNKGLNQSKFMLTDQDYGSTIDYIEQNFYKDLICK